MCERVNEAKNKIKHTELLSRPQTRKNYYLIPLGFEPQNNTLQDGFSSNCAITPNDKLLAKQL